MFIIAFYALCIICAILFWLGGWTSGKNETNKKSSSTDDASLKQFQRSYLLIYLAAAAGDWLQGPHVYALYQSYQMSKHEIELLFIAGFGSSMIFGTFIGSFADKYGRRRNCILYGLLFGGACITKHFANFWILMLGRLLGGIATSILYSAFESWLVFEHAKRGFDEDSLSTVFSFATFGNSLVAIGSGIVAQYAADMFGFVAPFDAALTILLVMCVLIVFTWSENFGDAKASLDQSFKEAWKCLREDRRILCLGLVQSLFEGAMYTFVLEWTPSLTEAAAATSKSVPPIANGATTGGSSITGAHIPHGYIFATFMVAIMVGSSLFRILCKITGPESFMRWVLLVSAVALSPAVLQPTNLPVVYGGFIVFEVCVGIFWPSMGFMRGIYVPEAARSTLMNFFRVPLNLIVVAILFKDLPMIRIFQCCILFMTLACVLQHVLYRQTQANPHVKSVGHQSESESEKNVDLRLSRVDEVDESRKSLIDDPSPSIADHEQI